MKKCVQQHFFKGKNVIKHTFMKENLKAKMGKRRQEAQIGTQRRATSHEPQAASFLLSAISFQWSACLMKPVPIPIAI